MPVQWIEPIGLAATVMVLVSLMQSDAKRLRILNALGSIIFVAYGLMKGALSVWILNGVCFAVNLYKLAKMSKNK